MLPSLEIALSYENDKKMAHPFRGYQNMSNL